MSADDKPAAGPAVSPEADPDPGGKGAGQEFISRWSRLKAEAKSKPVESAALQPEGEGLDPPADTVPQLTPQQLEDMTDDELLQHFDLPEPEALKQGDDFSVFMKAAVPARLRNRALRKLWLSNPALANVDMLVDYGDDFTDAAMSVPGMTTAYQVGKGIARKLEEFADPDRQNAAEARSDLAGAAPDSTSAERFTTAEDAPAGHLQQEAEPGAEDPVTDPKQASAADEPLRSDAEKPDNNDLAVQRMRFRFEG